jgi:hypothetical protein
MSTTSVAFTRSTGIICDTAMEEGISTRFVILCWLCLQGAFDAEERRISHQYGHEHHCRGLHPFHWYYLPILRHIPFVEGAQDVIFVSL